MDELLTSLFDGQSNLLTEPMTAWLDSSRRFTAFVTLFHDKIRKKLRTTPDPESLLDLWLELETAYLLLQERSLNVVYEPQLAGKVRGPDFAVTHTSGLTFMVEVTRLRGGGDGSQAAAQEPRSGILVPDASPELPLVSEHLSETIYSKLGQLLPKHANVLIIGVEGSHLTAGELRSLMVRIQQRAEHVDDVFWQRRRFRDRSDFFHSYQRLSEVLVRGSQLQADNALAVWVNPLAKHPLAGRVQTVFHRSHRL
jgi:hypothetical protein